MILYGASGHGKVIAEILEANGERNYEFWDDKEKPDIWSLPIYKPSFDENLRKDMIVCIGNNKVRKDVSDKINQYFVFSKAIHPSAIISNRTVIGEGSVIMALVVVNCDCLIGKHVILNTNCSIDHDCILENYVHVSPNAVLAGSVNVGEGTHVGIGACVIQGIKIGKWAIIGAGAVIIKDVPDNAVVVGNPGKIIKYNQAVS